MNLLKKSYPILLAIIIFITILTTHYPFYKAIILMLEFIVIMEVVNMTIEFIEKRKLRLRYILDVFIIFLIRDVVILSSMPNKPYNDILFLLLVIFAFFIFRFFAVRFSPHLKKKRSQ
ncbi:MAG: phosphate-starvation-inducible PsiE family protein [Sulfurovum sp.]|nr:phosphate-starvation-inducible PsiE family protein [Sulfurovum sp.]